MTSNYADAPVNDRVRARGGRVARVWIIGAAALALLTSGASAQKPAAPEGGATKSEPAAVAPSGGATASDIISKPVAYNGKTVTVSGEVGRVLGPRSFTIGGAEFYGGGELLVVSAKPIPAIRERPASAPLSQDDIVQVTGTVRTFVLTEVTRQVEDKLEGQLYAEWEDKPVLIADSMVVTARMKPGGAAGAPGAKGAPGAVGAPGAAGAVADPIPDLLIIVTAPDRPSLVGRRVQLTNVPVQSVVGDRTFWVGPSEKQRLFVVLDEERTPGTATEGKVDVNAGQTVTLTGVVRKLPGMDAARKQWNLSARAADGLKNEAIYLAAERVQTGKMKKEMSR